MAFNRLSRVIRSTISSSNRYRSCWLSETLPPLSSSYNSRMPFSHNSAPSSPDSPSVSSYHLNGGPSHMRGVVFWEPNKPLSIEDFNMPRPKAGEILIKTKACGVCHSDLHVIKGEIPFPSPCVVGHEITGEVVEHGPLTDRKIVESYPIGAHVIGAFIMPCGSCFYCSKGQDDLCEDFFAYNRAKGTLYDGETRLFLRNSGKPIFMYSMGGLAEYCVVPAHGLCVLPDTLPYTESAILGCAVFTCYGAMAYAAQVRAGGTAAVIGIGGVGSSRSIASESICRYKTKAVQANPQPYTTATALLHSIPIGHSSRGVSFLEYDGKDSPRSSHQSHQAVAA